MSNRVVRILLPASIVCVGVWQIHPAAQDRLKSMPGYARYHELAPQIPGALKSGAVAAVWSADGASFEYTRDGKRYRYDVAARQATPLGDAPEAAGRGGRGGRGQGAPERGRQYGFADSPDGAFRAQFNEKDRNLYLIDQGAKTETALTTDGSRERRIKNGSASWVYGEELDQITAMWWSPDSRKLAFYRFDESPVPDYYLQLDQTKLQSAVDTEAYPKAGVANPVVDLLIYDLASKKTTKLDVRDGKPFDNDGGRALRVSRQLDAGRARAAVQPHQPPAERARARRRQPGHRRPASGASRGVAHRLGREQPDHGVPPGRPALHLAIGTERLEQLLPLRSERHADRAADEEHHVRSGLAGEGRRSGGRDLLHRARWRQPSEAPAASRRARWPRRRPPDRPEVSSHHRRVHARGSGRAGPRRRGQLRDLAGQQAVRGRLPDPRRAAGDATGRRTGGEGGRRRGGE